MAIAPRPDFTNYLQAICDDYAQWWKSNAFIEEINEFTWFNFELDSKTQDKPQQPGEQPSERTLRVLQAVDDYASEKILIVGSPGSGKSTLLARIFYQSAQKARQGETALIPVLVELKAYQTQGDRVGIRGLIQSRLESFDPALNGADALQYLLQKEQRLLLLADGINELPQEQAKIELKDFCRRLPLIATTRSTGSELGIERKLELQPLSSQAVKQFFEERLPGCERRKLTELCDRVRDFGQTPLIIWMLYSISKATGETPTTLGEAYRAFTNLYIDRAKEGIDLAESRSLLAALAFAMMHSEKPTELRLAISEIEAQNLVGGERTLNHLLRHHLIERYGHAGDRRIRFCHQSLQEYYAAEALLHKLPTLTDIELKRDYLNYLKWTESISLMIGLLNDTDQVRQVVNLSLEVDLMLGASLAGKVKQHLIPHTVRLVDSLLVPQSLKIYLLGETLAEVIIPKLLKALENPDPTINLNSIVAIRKFNSKVAVSQLVKLFKHSNPNVRADAISALNDQCGEEVILELLDAFEDESRAVRQDASFKLIRLDSELVVPRLLKFLKNSNPDIRRRTVLSLGWLNSELAVPGLIEALEDEDYQVREKAADCLGYLNSQLAVPRLIAVLSDPKFAVRRSAAIALGRLGCEKAVPLLRTALKHSKVVVRHNAICVLKKLDYSVAISELSQGLEHTNPKIRERSVETICDIPDPVLIPKVISTLNDPDPNVRLQAIFALGKIEQEFVVLSLLQALKDSEPLVRSVATAVLLDRLDEVRSSEVFQYLEKTDINNWICAISWIGTAGTNKATIPELLRIFERVNHTVRRIVAVALGKLGRKEAIPELLEALKDSDFKNRERVAEILGNLGDEVAVPGLIEALKDLDVSVRKSAAKSLGKLCNEKDEKSLSSLLILLNDSDLDVRLAAIESLEKIGAPVCLPHFRIAQLHGMGIGSKINNIQKRSGIYNYDIFRMAEEKDDFLKSIGSEEEEYQKVLSILSDMAMVIERNPESFRELGEEAIRDHFLVQLNGTYQGKATGETFNGRGKTDLLLRVDGENVLVAECKFWGGSKKLRETLDQLLEYVTWRDTKLAILIFNRNKNLTAVLKQIPGAIGEHPNFVREVSGGSETQFRFDVSYPNDRERKLLLTVLAFDIPS